MKALEDEKKKETEDRLVLMKKARSWLCAAGILKDIETLDEPVEVEQPLISPMSCCSLCPILNQQVSLCLW